MRELASVLGMPDKPIEVEIPEGLHITTMTRYNGEFPFPIAFPPGSMTNVLAEWLGKQGVKQCHIAGGSSSTEPIVCRSEPSC
jgi:2,3-bisphosphoglycerate-independent phosphoglycerate mutase